MSHEVPVGWRKGRISELVVEVTQRIAPQAVSDPDIPYLGLEDIGQGSGTILSVGRAQDATSQKSCFSSGDILFGKLRPNLKKVARPDFDGICSTDISVFRAKEQVDPDFAFWVLSSDSVIEHAVAHSAGTKMPRAHARSILSFETTIPPLNEQQQIAEVLRSADEASAAARSVVGQFDDVIKTEIDTVVTDLVADPTVPMVRLGEIASVKGGKRLPKGSVYSDSPTGFRYIRVTDWSDHEIDPTNVKWISDEAAAAIKRYTISSADLFISIAGSIGLVATVPPELDGAFLTENAAKIVVREIDRIDRDYLLSVMISSSLIAQIQQQKGVGGGVPKLALFRIEALEIPLPSLERQQDIAAAYRSLKSARIAAAQSSASSGGLRRKLSADLLSGRVRVPS